MSSNKSLLLSVLLLLAYMSLDNSPSHIHCYLLRQKSGRTPLAFRAMVHQHQHQQQQESPAGESSSPTTATTAAAPTTTTSLPIIAPSPQTIISQPIFHRASSNKFANCSAKRQHLLSSHDATPTEHVPDCEPDGSYKAMQCMQKMGVCWCVDYNGKFIQNTQSEKPDCGSVARKFRRFRRKNCVGRSIQLTRQNIYIQKYTGQAVKQSADQVIASKQRLFNSRNNKKDNNNLAAETHTQRIGAADRIDSDIEFGMFQFGSQLRAESATPLAGASSSASIGGSAAASEQSDQTLVLIPGDCATSRSRQLAKSKEFPESRPWVPDCDYSNASGSGGGGGAVLYSGLQCHVANTSICFCVDTYTGLPLRGIPGTTIYLDSSEIDLSNGQQEMKKPDCEAANKLSRTNPTEVETAPKLQPSISICGGNKTKKNEFLLSMVNSFQAEVINRINLNDSLGKEFNYSQFGRLTRVQIMKWKFQSMDKNNDNQLDDNEWAVFRSLVKLARDEEQQRDYKEKIMNEQKRDYRALKLLEDKQQTNMQTSQPTASSLPLVAPIFVLKPARLVLLIPQRQCWSEFLDSCENKSRTRQLITMQKWFDCTETYPVRYPGRHDEANAANQRRHNKNPFLSILKTD